MSEALLFLQSIKDLRLYIIDSYYGSYSWKPSRFYPQIHVSSYKSDKKAIEATDSTSRLGFFEMTLCCNGEERKWMVQHGKGNTENTQTKLIGII